MSAPETGIAAVMTATGVPEGCEWMPNPSRKKRNPKMARKRATASKTRWLIVSSTNLLLPSSDRAILARRMLVAADGDSPAGEDPPDEGAKGDLLQPEYGSPCEPGRHVEQHGDGENGEQQPTEPHENALHDVQRLPFEVALLLQDNRTTLAADALAHRTEPPSS